MENLKLINIHSNCLKPFNKIIIINKYTFKRSDFSYKTHINKSNLSQSQRPTQYNQFNQFTQIIKKKTLSDKNESEPKDNLSKRSINKKLYSSVNQNIFFTRQK